MANLHAKKDGKIAADIFFMLCMLLRLELKSEKSQGKKEDYFFQLINHENWL